MEDLKGIYEAGELFVNTLPITNEENNSEPYLNGGHRHKQLKIRTFLVAARIASEFTSSNRKHDALAREVYGILSPTVHRTQISKLGSKNWYISVNDVEVIALKTNARSEVRSRLTKKNN